jgi:glutamate synthase domain-containing protein 2/glutamate synthase domain-containing protein 1/glutamate synthase domain-containing protein 3
MQRKGKSLALGAGGLWDPAMEHDACGVGFVVHIKGQASHAIVEKGLEILVNLEHRGATGSESNTGDGAGILMQVPDAFFRKVLPLELPPRGEYGVGLVFLPTDAGDRATIEALMDRVAAREGARVLGWRDVPCDNRGLGRGAVDSQPFIRQVFIVLDGAGPVDTLALERKLYVIRKLMAVAVDRLEGIAEESRRAYYVASLSARTLIYKGMLTARQLGPMFPDLLDPEMTTALALVHQRFSTNTFPSWPLAHPYRYIAHNGEINTLRGNINWMRAREGLLRSELFGDDLKKTYPVIREGGSDTASFDNVLELLHLAGRSLPHAVLMMIPEPWSGHESMAPDRKAFYEYHESLMEPWDGPASIAFTDGTVIGAVLDRNGLRPSRYYVTKDDLVIMASEVGVLDVPPENVLVKERLHPGRIFLVDTGEGRIVDDEEIKGRLAAEHPYQKWLDRFLVPVDALPAGPTEVPEHETILTRLRAFGYTQEDIRLLMAPMAMGGKPPVGSMGTDTSLAVLSDRPRLLFDYFKQLFAQVTNPPLDAIREEIVTAIGTTLGPERNLFAPEPESCQQIQIDSPILHNEQLARIRHLPADSPFKSRTLSMLYDPSTGGRGLEAAMDRLCREASAALEEGCKILILSDRGIGPDQAPVPSLMAVAGVHHHLVREGTRAGCALVVEAGDAREVHHITVLIGYGAGAVNPYVAFEALDDMIQRRVLTGITYDGAVQNFIGALNKGILKVMSKMGISTVPSYCGAQIYEAIGLDQDFVDRYFTYTTSRLSGIGIDVVAEEVRRRHVTAFGPRPAGPTELDPGGEYQWRRDGEYHLFNPESVFKLQHATSSGRYEIFKEYAGLVDRQSEHRATLRGLFEFRPTGPSVPIDEVEPAEEIFRRLSTGAMSYGSISQEAHELLAVAMNRIGGRSNTGEGGEDPTRFVPDENGDSRRSAIKQVASGRFGVTSEYLVNADDIQIKMAQGAKPGEGGQLPGHKVYPWIAKVRHSTPGVGLISPPPHHDIYSIEDLAQLIFDLKNSNPRARIHVKLVAEAGVGTVAAGVAKAHADVVLISGYDGGTGASPLTSIKHAGLPWELGLAETQQVLVENRLRDRIVVQVDGQMKTGRDVVVAALLGAEEYGFATAPLVVMGCIMMRVCHLNTCPVGVATQDPELREKFTGRVEHVVNFFRFIAQEVRELMAELGFRTMDEMIGRADCLGMERAVDHWKANGLNLSPLFHVPDMPPEVARRCVTVQDHGLDGVLDHTLIARSASALEHRTPVKFATLIRNKNRTVGAMLGYEVTRRYGGAGLPDDTIDITFTGSAGQSFGAFVPRGVTMTLVGDANDGFGKGLSGGKLRVFPPPESTFAAEDNIVVGNVAFYGATGGEAFVRGVAGERFCVRNSGVEVVVEGVGDHACEYMTGGRAIVIGPTGRNFAAGMSGGVAYVLDQDGTFSRRCNMEMVDLEPFDDPTDLDYVQTMLMRHIALTGSPYVERLVADWGALQSRIVKVMPREYKRALMADRQRYGEGVEGPALEINAADGDSGQSHG